MSSALTTLVTAEELLAGSDATFDVDIPPALLHPTADGTPPTPSAPRTLRIRPLTVRDVQLIAKAARADEVLTSVLMIQRAVIEPSLKEKEISQMHSGLVRFLVDRINRVSGLGTSDDELADVASSPLAQAFFVMAKEFGWTPEQVRELTVGQILGYLELLNERKRGIQ